MPTRNQITYKVLLIAFLAAGCPKDPLPQVALWDRWESSFEANQPIPAGSHDDVALTVVLESEHGLQIRQPGFWAGGNTWKVRWLADQQGEWIYRTESDPPIEGLDGMTGAFEVDISDSENRFLINGAIRISENGRHLEHANGKPFLWMGDTAWNGALKSTATAWDTFLTDRVNKGFTGVQFVTTQWRAADGNLEGEVAYSGFDDIEINPYFFNRIDDRIDAINDTGLLAAPVLLWALGEPDRNPGRLPESQAVKLARYIVARYGGHHVLWILAGDENYAEESGERWRSIGRAVFEAPHPGLVTTHPQGRQWFFDDFLDEDWLDVIIYQSSHGGGPGTLNWLQMGPPAQKWTNSPTRPIFNSEPGYEDHVAWEIDEIHSGDDVRRQFYWSLLNTPVAGLTYGAHGIWSWEIEPATPMNHPNSGIAKPWHEAMHLPGSTYFMHAAALFESLDWPSLRPAPTLIVNQSPDPLHHIGAATSADGKLAVVYQPTGGMLALDVGKLTGGLTATWFNPRDGNRMSAKFEATGKFESPDSQDWVLLLEQ